MLSSGQTKRRLLRGGAILILAALAAGGLFTLPRLKGGVRVEGTDGNAQRETARVFFSLNGERLAAKTVDIEAGTGEKAKGDAIIQELRRQKSIPGRARLLDLAFGEDGTLYVNLSREFGDAPTGGGTDVTRVYSVVNSFVATFPAFRRVQLLLEGQVVPTIGGLVYTQAPLEFNKDIVGE